MYCTKLESLNEVDDLDIYHLPKLNQDQVNNLNSPITPENIKSLNLPTTTKTKQTQNKKPNQGQMVLVQNSTRLSKKS